MRRSHPTRQRLEAVELWLRRLVNDQFESKLGSEYIMLGEWNGHELKPLTAWRDGTESADIWQRGVA